MMLESITRPNTSEWGGDDPESESTEPCESHRGDQGWNLRGPAVQRGEVLDPATRPTILLQGGGLCLGPGRRLCPRGKPHPDR